METYLITKGQIPFWNILDEMGNTHLGSRGMAMYYPLRWWLYLPTYLGGEYSYFAQYMQICIHMVIGLSGIFILLNNTFKFSPDIACLSSSVFLLNQRFNDFIRYPNGIESIVWIPWILISLMNILKNNNYFNNYKNWKKEEWKSIILLILFVQLSWLAGYGHMTYIGLLMVFIILLINLKRFKHVIISTTSIALGSILSIGNLSAIYLELKNSTKRSGNNIEWASNHSVASYSEMLFNPYNIDIHWSGFTLLPFLFLSIIGILITLFVKKKIVINTSRVNLIGWFISLIIILDTSRGCFGFTYKILYDYLPFFDAFRNPGRNNWIAFIPLSVFIAYGIQYITSINNKKLIFIIITLSIISIALHFYLIKYSYYIFRSTPVTNNWIKLNQSSLFFIILLFISFITIFLYIRSKKIFYKAFFIIVLTYSFSLLFSKYNTWHYGNDKKGFRSVLSVSELYKNGILNGFSLERKNSSDPFLYDSNYKKDIKELNIESPTKFPQSRFVWMPEDKTSKIDLEIKTINTNSLIFRASNFTKGVLVLLYKYDSLWNSNTDIFPYKFSEKSYISFKINNDSTIKLNYKTGIFTATGLISLIMFFLLVIILFIIHSKYKVSFFISTIGIFVISSYFALSRSKNYFHHTDLFGDQTIQESFRIEPIN